MRGYAPDLRPRHSPPATQPNRRSQPPALADQDLALVALQRLDKNRVLQGKPKYGDLDGMIASYIEATAERGMDWSADEAESEVVRYLSRQALADEGGLDGDGQDNANFALLALLLGLAGYAAASSFGLTPAEVSPEPVQFW